MSTQPDAVVGGNQTRAILRYLSACAAFWLAYFLGIRALFLLAHGGLAASLSAADGARVFLYGLRLDVSATGYLLLVPVLLLGAAPFLAGRRVAAAIHGWVAALLLLFALLVVADAELYRHWSFRLDSSPLFYLRTPKEAVASIPGWRLAGALAAAGALFAVSAAAYRRLVAPLLAAPAAAPSRRQAALMLLVGAALFLPIRGTLRHAPLNTGYAFFHKTNDFANHAAVNLVWNFVSSLQRLGAADRPAFMPPAEAAARVRGRYASPGPTTPVLRGSRPNVILVIVESFSSKVIGSLGGRPGVTPHFDRLSREGILFEHYYAGTGRTDRALVALLSGYPAQQRTAVIRYPKKTLGLPYLSRDLARLGYRTSFLYGGELEFANMRSYVAQGRFDRVVAKGDFGPGAKSNRWGVHDEHLFARLLEEAKAAPEPFFSVALTSSSHEPFSIPAAGPYPTDRGDDERFFNAVWYADRCLGEFVERARREPWWANTLLVVVADHGHARPGPTRKQDSATYKIPMLWLGGAVAGPARRVVAIGTQTDLAATLLAQLGAPADAYPWSADLFAARPPGFAYYVFYDGFGFVRPRTRLVWDNERRERGFTYRLGYPSAEEERDALAYYQAVMEDFVSR
jgi:phosphoglycerol transferase MdoB-like AlkP superfamily enzyme